MKTIKLLLVMLASLVVVACGGGGGDSPPPANNLSGTAAVGAPVVGAAVNVKCAAGTALSNIPVTSTTGTWSVTLSGQTLPCAVQVSGGTVGGAANTTAYQSIATSLGTVNVTPLTSLLVANLAGTATPNTWFANLTPAQLSAITSTQVGTSLTNLRTALKLTALNAIDPITLPFNPAPGVAMDDILSALGAAMASNPALSYANLLASSGASAGAAITPPAGLDAALATALANTPSGGGSGGTTGTAAQYFSKKAVGSTWTWNGLSQPNANTSSEVMTITASAGNVVTVSDTYTSGSTTYPPDIATLELDATGAWVTTLGTYKRVLLPATFSVGKSWVGVPADPATGNSATVSTIAAFNVTRTVPAGTFTDCLQVNSTKSSTTSGVTTSTTYYSPSAGIFVEAVDTDSNGGTKTTKLQTYGTVQTNGTAAQYFSKKAVGNSWTWNWQPANSTTPDVKARTVTASTGGVVTTAYTYTFAGGTTPAPRSETLKLDATGAWVITSGTFSSVILPATFAVGTTWVSEPADPAAGTSAVTDTVKAFNVIRTVPAGTFTDCIQVDSTFSFTNGTTVYNSTRYYSPTTGMYVETINYDSAGVVTGTEQLQAGYIANP